jgi:Zincin-like metallopeptidase
VLCRYRHKTHWSGASHRLARNLKIRFGDDAYAMEELIALSGQSGRRLSGQLRATRGFSGCMRSRRCCRGDDGPARGAVVTADRPKSSQVPSVDVHEARAGNSSHDHAIGARRIADDGAASVEGLEPASPGPSICCLSSVSVAPSTAVASEPPLEVGSFGPTRDLCTAKSEDDIPPFHLLAKPRWPGARQSAGPAGRAGQRFRCVQSRPLR